MADLFSRLDKYLKFKGLNDNNVTVQTGIANGIIGKGRKRGALSQENLEKLLQYYDDLNANWLFRGSGEMLTNSADNSTQSDFTKHISTLQDLTEYQRKEIKNLKNALAECKKGKL